MTEIVFWLMGSFEDRSMRHVFLSLPFIIASCLILLRCGAGYRALTLGEDVARSLGINVEATRFWTIAASACGSGPASRFRGRSDLWALSRRISYGPFVDGDPHRVLVPSCLVGAALLMTADICVRLIPATSADQGRRRDRSDRRAGLLYLVAGQRAFVSKETGP